MHPKVAILRPINLPKFGFPSIKKHEHGKSSTTTIIAIPSLTKMTLSPEAIIGIVTVLTAGPSTLLSICVYIRKERRPSPNTGLLYPLQINSPFTRHIY